MASWIVDRLPRHTVYVEPFCGGAAVMFKKPWPPATNNNYYREILNDKDERLINLYDVVRKRETFEQFLEIAERPYSRARYRDARLRMRSGDSGDSGDKVLDAADYWINVSQSVGNKLHGGWGTNVCSQNSAATWLARIELLPQYLDRLMSVYLECDDALAVIKRWDSPQTLFYCDPPYPGTNQGGYDGYTQEDFAALCDTLDNAQGSFALSCYDNESAREGWVRHEKQAHCAADGKGQVGGNRDKTRSATSDELGDRTRTECLWVVDRSANARPECQQIWKQWGWEEGVGMGEAFGTVPERRDTKPRKVPERKIKSHRLF